MENVQVRVTDKLDQGTSRECRAESVQPGIGPTDCGDIHMLAGVLCSSLAKDASYFTSLQKFSRLCKIERYG